MIECPPSVLERIPDMLHDAEVERVAVFVGHRDGADVTIVDIWKAENNHRDPLSAFAIGREQWHALQRRARAAGMGIVGIVHSHPHGHPDEASPDDVRFAARTPWAARAVYHSPTGQLIWYDRGGETGREALPLSLPLRIINRLMG